MRARCSSACGGGAERARQVVKVTEVHLDTGYQRACRSLCRPGVDLPFAHQRAGGGLVAGQREAHELLLIEEADAWFEYLEATRGQSALRYKEVEPWAWARLTQRLRAIKTRRAKLRPVSEAA